MVGAVSASFHVAGVGEVGLGRLEGEGAFVGVVAAGGWEVFFLFVTTPGLDAAGLVVGLRVGHPGEHLGSGDEPNIRSEIQMAIRTFICHPPF